MWLYKIEDFQVNRKILHWVTPEKSDLQKIQELSRNQFLESIANQIQKKMGNIKIIEKAYKQEIHIKGNPNC